MLSQQYAVTTQSVRAANQFADSLSQYSKHSDEAGHAANAGANSEILMGGSVHDTKSKISAIYS